MDGLSSDLWDTSVAFLNIFYIFHICSIHFNSLPCAIIQAHGIVFQKPIIKASFQKDWKTLIDSHYISTNSPIKNWIGLTFQVTNFQHTLLFGIVAHQFWMVNTEFWINHLQGYSLYQTSFFLKENHWHHHSPISVCLQWTLFLFFWKEEILIFNFQCIIDIQNSVFFIQN